MSAESPGRKAVLHCTFALTSLLKHNLSCSGKLLEKGLITEAVHDWILTAPAVSNQEKAARLVSCLADRVKSAQLFHELIEALKETDPFCGDIVDKLTEAFHKTSVESNETAVRVVNKKQEVKSLEKKFSSLQKRLLSEMLVNPAVTPQAMLVSLAILPVELQGEYKKFVEENLSTLEQVGSVTGIFTRISLHFTFLDYRLLTHLTEEFGSEQLQEDMLSYVETMESFVDETTVEQLMDHWPGRRDIPPHFEELRAVVGDESSTYTLRQLDNLRMKFCSETKLSETVFVFIGVGRKNSFVVCWMVPSIFVPQLKSVISSLRSFYQREHIFSVTVDRQRLYSIAAEYEERLLFLCSSGTGDISEFQYLLRQPGLDTNIYDKNSLTPLYCLSAYGRTELVQLLLEHGAEVDLPNDDAVGDTPLRVACKEGRVAAAALLIEKGADINNRIKSGVHALYSASFEGKLEIVKLLLDHGAQIDLPANDDLGFTALGIACQQGHVHVARLLIDKGVAIDYQNKEGVSPLYKASEEGHDDVVQLLLDSGASVDLPAKTSKKPVVCGLSDSVQDHDSTTKKCVHITPLLKACSAGRTHTASLLIEARADINYQEDGWTPLIASSTYRHTDTVQLLVEKKARLNIQTKEGWTALSLASWRGHTKIVEILVQAGADANIQGQAGLTALMLAAQNGHANIAKTLLDGKADPNITDKTSGWTAIFFAIEQNNLEIIELLIRGGAKLDIKDKNGLTAFEVAKANDRQAVCDLLEKHGSKTTGKEITQEQREQVKASSQHLKKVLDFLERTLLREKAKKEQQPAAKGGTSSNIFRRRREKQLAKKMKGMTIHMHTDTTTKFVS